MEEYVEKLMLKNNGGSFFLKNLLFRYYQLLIQAV